MPDVNTRFPYMPIQPGSYSALDASALIAAAQGPATPVPAIVGDCRGGAPNTALYFRDPQSLKAILRSGAAFDAARFALLGGATRVCVVRAGAPLQAAKTLGASSGTGLQLTSVDYGAWTNQIKVTVEANNKVTITYVDGNGVTFTEVYAVGASATAQDVADAINGKKATFAKSQYVTAVAGAGTMPLSTAAISALTGGSDGSSLVAGDWTNALVALETEDISIVVPATGDATIHAAAVTHCNAMSTTQARRERTANIGGVLSESVAQVVARAAALRDKRVQLVYPGVQLPDATGVNTLYDPFMAAAYLAGMHCGLVDPATSLIHAEVGVVDVEKRLSTIAGGDVDTLLAAGVTPIAPRPTTGFWVVDNLSTYTADKEFRDYHKIRSIDASASRLRTRLEAKFVGGKTLISSAGQIKLDAMNELRDQTTEGLIRGYQEVAVTEDPSDSRVTFVTAPILPVDARKFILLTVALQPSNAAAVNAETIL